MKETPSPPSLRVLPNAVLDPRVLNAVLADLLTYKGDDSPVVAYWEEGKGKQTPPSLYFDPQPCLYNCKWQPQANDTKNLWRRLPHTDRAAFNTAAEHSNWRIKVRDIADPRFRPADRRVILPAEMAAREREARKKNKNALPWRWLPWMQPIQAWPPGYSANRKHAVVRMSIPWSIHSATGSFALTERRDGRWVVVFRQFLYYV